MRVYTCVYTCIYWCMRGNTACACILAIDLYMVYVLVGDSASKPSIILYFMHMYECVCVHECVYVYSLEF